MFEIILKISLKADKKFRVSNPIKLLRSMVSCFGLAVLSMAGNCLGGRNSTAPAAAASAAAEVPTNHHLLSTNRKNDPEEPLNQSFIEISNQVTALENQVAEELHSKYSVDWNRLLLPSVDWTKVGNLSALCGYLRDSIKKIDVLTKALNTYRKANGSCDDHMARSVDSALPIKGMFHIFYKNVCVGLHGQAAEQFHEVLDRSKQLLLACESLVGDRVKGYDKIVAEVKDKQVLLNTHIDAFKLFFRNVIKIVFYFSN